MSPVGSHLGVPATGTYRLRAQQVGFLPVDTTLSAGTSSQHLVLRLQPLPVRLANLPAESPQHGCAAPQLAESGASPAVAMVLAQVRQNAERYRILLDQYPFNYRLAESRAVLLNVHTRDETDSVIALDTATYDSRQRHQYAIGGVVYEQRSVSGGKRMMMFIPTLSDLADAAFAVAHCFAYVGDVAHELRIDFRPADVIKAPDVTGSIYLDDARYVVKRAVFTLTHAGAVGGAAPYVKVTATFREEVPFVPMLVSSRTEQPLTNVTTGGLQSMGSLADQGAKNVGGFSGYLRQIGAASVHSAGSRARPLVHRRHDWLPRPGARAWSELGVCGQRRLHDAAVLRDGRRTHLWHARRPQCVGRSCQRCAGEDAGVVPYAE